MARKFCNSQCKRLESVLANRLLSFGEPALRDNVVPALTVQRQAVGAAAAGFRLVAPRAGIQLVTNMPIAANPRVLLTIAICTHNRCDLLVDVIDSLFSLRVPDGMTFEALVVDNASTDYTRDYVEDRIRRHPGNVRYVLEEKPGLSYARNHAITAAHGHYIAFVDDDIRFGEDWLAAVFAAVKSWPETECFGGRVLPVFDGGRPDWLEPELLWMYGHIDFGALPCRMVFPRFPFGCNMIFQRTLFDKVGDFDPRLGRTPFSLLSNEEFHLFHRVNRMGMAVMYLPKALVYHRIPVSRLDPGWVVRRSFWQGISGAVSGQLLAPRSRFALLRSTLGTMVRLLGEIKGPSWSPVKIYSRLNRLPVAARARFAGRIGLAWGKLGLAFGARKHLDP